MILTRGAPVPEFTVPNTVVKCIHKYVQISIPTHGNTIGHADIMSLLLQLENLSFVVNNTYSVHKQQN